jgi:hypothetical protein
MRKDLKNDMRKRARACLGLTDLIKDDIIQLRADLHDFDILCLEESLKDTKATIQMFIDNVTEIEYMLYLLKARDS